MEGINYYLFDPIQFKEFGDNFFEGKDFYFRYQSSKKIFFENIYIPFGPNCFKKEGFLNFTNHINALRFKKITIDLPMIYCREIKEDVLKAFKKNNFKEKPYFYQDEETILIKKENFRPKIKLMNEVKHGYKAVDVIVKNQLTEDESKAIYEIYLVSSKRIGFKPKQIDVFKKLSENCLVSLAYSKKDYKIQGFVFGYLFNTCAKDFYDKDTSKILLVMFAAETDLARENKIGHAMYYKLIKTSFEEHDVDIIDLHGASRTKNRNYTVFKQKFSKNFYPLPGSFSKIPFF